MYRVELKNGDTFETPYSLCFNESGSLFGVLTPSMMFISIVDVCKITENNPKQIYPPANDPEKRPFKVGDKVKVVSHKGFWELWPGARNEPD